MGINRFLILTLTSETTNSTLSGLMLLLSLAIYSTMDRRGISLLWYFLLGGRPSENVDNFSNYEAWSTLYDQANSQALTSPELPRFCRVQTTSPPWDPLFGERCLGPLSDETPFRNRFFKILGMPPTPCLRPWQPSTNAKAIPYPLYLNALVAAWSDASFLSARATKNCLPACVSIEFWRHLVPAILDVASPHTDVQ
jgi:hypothetical protein